LLSGGIYQLSKLWIIYPPRLIIYEIVSILILAIAFVAVISIITSIHRNLRNQEGNFESTLKIFPVRDGG